MSFSFLLVQSEKSAHLQQEQSEDKQQNLVYCSCKLGNRWLIYQAQWRKKYVDAKRY